MNLFTVNYQSDALHKRTTVHVLLPPQTENITNLPTLTLLHGMTDDQSGWIRHTLAENYAEDIGMALVVPNADLSFYTNMAYGGDYLTFLAEELPAFLKRYFPLANEKDRNFIAGNSMGGYGSFLLAMQYPNQYRAAFSLSGPMKISWIYRVLSDKQLADTYASLKEPERQAYIEQFSAKEKLPQLLVSSLLESGDITRVFRGMFGDNLTTLDGTDIDLISLVKRDAFLKNPVDLHAYCGEQDYHYASNLLFRDLVNPLDIPYHLTTETGGHDWSYWNRHLPTIFKTIQNYTLQM